MESRTGLAAFSALWFACAASGAGRNVPSMPPADVEDRMRALEVELGKTHTDLAEVRTSTQDDALNRQRQLDRTVEELARLRQDVDSEARRLEALANSIEQLRAEFEKRYVNPPLAEVPTSVAPDRRKRQKPSSATGSTAPAASSPAISLPATLTPDQAEIFTLARDQESKGRRSVAREVYQQYLAKWPKDSSAAEVHFRLGELAFEDQNYPDAIGDYATVARDFPESPRAPDALLRTAEAMNKLALQEDAERVLAQLLKRYPNTAAATRGKAQLTGASRGKKPSN
ncbi:MAG TPA: tetratricopeptide repeat protein [Anaeromyxobacteraceae bacterium]|nr:tetratricopeptide repeat protein [Anaeromyxobacteraceae bacterium]